MLLSVYLCIVVTYWERAYLSALFVVSHCKFVRHGTRLYRFLIFAPLLTLITNGLTKLLDLLFRKHVIVLYVAIVFEGNAHNMKPVLSCTVCSVAQVSYFVHFTRLYV